MLGNCRNLSEKSGDRKKNRFIICIEKRSNKAFFGYNMGF